MQVEIDQLRDERLQHLQALVQMTEQVELMDQDLEAANGLIIVLQQPPPPLFPGAMEGNPNDAQSGMDSESATPHPAPGVPASPESSAASVGNLDDF